MHKRILSCAVFALAAICWLLPAQAQDQDNDGVAELVKITPKAGKGPDLEAAIKDFHHWVADMEGSFRYSWYMVETGPDTGKYIARTGDHNWADFDQEFEWEDEVNARFEADILPLVEHAERVLTVEMDEFSHWPEDFSGYTLFQIENWYVKPGMYGKFRAGLEKIHKALIDAEYGQYYGFQNTVSGAKGNQIALVLAHKNYAGMAEESPSFYEVVSEALGGPEAFEALMQDFGSTYHAGESFLVRYLPEASSYGDEE